MKKLIKIMAVVFCNVLIFTGCGSAKTAAKASGSIPEKTTTSKTQSIESDVETPTPTPKKEEIDCNKFNYGGLCIPVPTNFATKSESGTMVGYSTPNKDGIVTIDVIDLTDEWKNSDINYLASQLSSGINENAVPANEKEIKIAGYDGGMFNTSIDQNNSISNVLVYYIKNTDTNKAIVIVCGPYTGSAYLKYYNNLPDMIEKSPNVTPQASSNAPTATPTPTPSQAPTDTSQVTPELKAFLDSYEAFMDQYVSFMQKYKSDPTNAELLSEYSTYIDKLSDFEKKANEYSATEGSMSTADYNYYIDTMARISKKLISAGTNTQ